MTDVSVCQGVSDSAQALSPKPAGQLGEGLSRGPWVLAVGAEAALGDWRYVWAPHLIAPHAAPTDGDDGTLAPPSGVTPALDPEALCGAGAVRGTGGWSDVARSALDVGAGRNRVSARLWSRIATRATASLGPHHPDVAIALHIHGALHRGGGNETAVILSQRYARSALIAAAGGNKALAERSITYARSLFVSAEAFLARGQNDRALRYLKLDGRGRRCIRGPVAPPHGDRDWPLRHLVRGRGV